MFNSHPNQANRGPSPTTNGSNSSSKDRKTKKDHGRSKRARHVESVHAMVLDQVDEGTVETESPTVLSTSASEISSRGSNTSEPPLLDFIGVTCFASAWFTSCFPCAVVDINDKDYNVVDKLSRASAMNVMYATPYERETPSEIHVPSTPVDEVQEQQHLSYHESESAPTTIRTQVIDHHELMKLRKKPSHVSDVEDEYDATDSVGAVSLSDEPEQLKPQQLTLDKNVVEDEDLVPPPASDSDQDSSPRRKRFNFSRPKGIRFGKRKQ
mmetsp:Transcript_32512/g.62602  ORF Transcript_32512/g.62602 Transcript_32512/m.62602 type:complete len:268 (+) Transcript_32512:188-991(+)